MFQLIRLKINEVQFMNGKGSSELRKNTGILGLTIRRNAKGNNPIFIEYAKALGSIEVLNNKFQELQNNLDFAQYKKGLLSIVSILLGELEANNVEELSIFEIIDGKVRTNQWNEIHYALLMVEQNNLDFFHSRESRNSDEQHDRLHNHYSITGDNLLIHENSGLTSDIIEEVMQALQITTRISNEKIIVLMEAFISYSHQDEEMLTQLHKAAGQGRIVRIIGYCERAGCGRAGRLLDIEF